jgi:hypothetical protein
MRERERERERERRRWRVFVGLWQRVLYCLIDRSKHGVMVGGFGIGCDLLGIIGSIACLPLPHSDVASSCNRR